MQGLVSKRKWSLNIELPTWSNLEVNKFLDDLGCRQLFVYSQVKKGSFRLHCGLTNLPINQPIKETKSLSPTSTIALLSNAKHFPPRPGIDLLTQPGPDYFCEFISSIIQIAYNFSCRPLSIFTNNERRGSQISLFGYILAVLELVLTERRLKVMDKIKILHYSCISVVYTSPNPCFFGYLKSYFHFCIFSYQDQFHPMAETQTCKVVVVMLMCCAPWLPSR